jgi:GxxExxY protein
MNAKDDSAESDPQTYAIIGACMAVHNELGHGFLEAVYQEALAIEFARRGIPFEREKRLIIYFTGVPWRTTYDADFYCYDSIIVELKAHGALAPGHFAQTIHYLKATRSERGLLVNFGAPRLEYKRVVFTHSTPSDSTEGPAIPSNDLHSPHLRSSATFADKSAL